MLRFSVESVAKKMNISMAQVAIAWSLSKEGRAIHDLPLAPFEPAQG
jgi:aryl-alcohol dehydrogenase-like predicted oxidoreductase